MPVLTRISLRPSWGPGVIRASRCNRRLSFFSARTSAPMYQPGTESLIFGLARSGQQTSEPASTPSGETSLHSANGSLCLNTTLYGWGERRKSNSKPVNILSSLPSPPHNFQLFTLVEEAKFYKIRVILISRSTFTYAVIQSKIMQNMYIITQPLWGGSSLFSTLICQMGKLR